MTLMDNKHLFVELNDPCIMGKTFNVELHDEVFQEMGGYINKGNIIAKAVCRKATHQEFTFAIHAEGNVFTPCDRCLEDVDLRIDIDNVLNVIIGDEDDDEGDVLMVSKVKPKFDLTSLVYQFVALSLPIRRVHQPGMCNETMMTAFMSHQVARSEEEADEEPAKLPSGNLSAKENVDHRWDKLKQLLNK